LALIMEVKIVTKYAEELNRRIQSGEPVHITRDWYLDCICNNDEPLFWADLSLQEQMFSERLMDAYAAWVMQQAAREEKKQKRKQILKGWFSFR
jgi:hypothetical protein